jgi:RNA-binding protein
MLTPRQIRYLRGLAHGLRPLLRVGQQGVTPPLLAELDAALEAHELIKVRIAASDRQERQKRLAALAAGSGAAIVQTIGHTVTLYRPSTRHPRLLPPGDR